MTEQTEKTAQTTKAKSPKRLWRWILCLVSAVIFLPILALFALLSTESGQHKLLQWADAGLDTLSIEQAQGNLKEGLTLKHLRFQTEGVDAHIEEAHLQLQLSCLWHLDVCIDDITLTQPSILIDTSLLPASEPKKNSNGKMKHVFLPISVKINRLAVNDFSLSLDKNKITLGTFHTAASLNNANGLTLAPTQIENFSFIHDLTSTTKNTDTPKKTETSTPIQWEELEQSLRKPLFSELQQIELPFAIHIQGVQGKNWRYQSLSGKNTVEQDILVSSAELQAHATDDIIELAKFDVQSSLGQLQANGQVAFQQDFPLQFDAFAKINDIRQNNDLVLPASQAEIHLSGALKKQTALSWQTQGALESQLNAQIQAAEPNLPLQVNLTVPQAQYPFNNKDPLKIQDFNFTLDGNLATAQIQLKSAVSGMGIPNSNLALQAVSHLSGIEIHQLKLNTSNGTADLTGNLNWRDGVEWNWHLALAKMALGAYLSDFPAIISGSLNSQGKITQDKQQISVSDIDLQGSLSQRPLSLTGNLHMAEQPLLNVPQLTFTYGDNKINAQGNLGSVSDFTLDINAPNLSGLLIGLSASVNGKGAVTGNIMHPNLVMDLTAKQFHFRDIGLTQAGIKGQLNTEQQIQGQLNAQLNGFHYNDIKVNSLQLSASGDEQKHSLQLISEGYPIAANMNIIGNFDRTLQQWQGTISQLMLKTEFGHIQTNKSVSVTYDNKSTQSTIAAHCWMHSNIDLCFPQTFNVGTNGEIPFEIKRFDLAFINKILEEDLLKGKLNSKGKVAWSTQAPLSAEIQINGNALSLAKKLDYRTFKLDMPKVVLNANLANNDLALKTEVHVQEQGKINADLKLQDIANTRKLSGTFTIPHLNPAIVNQLLANDEKVSGELKANLTLGGNLSAPTLNGDILLKQLNAKIRALPFDIKNSELALHFAGTNSTLKGFVQTDDSRLNLSGEAHWKNINEWRTRLNAQAEKFKVDIPSMAKLTISPNVEITASPKLLELSGNIEIPKARIAIESLPESAIEVSTDEVILDGKTKRTLPKNIPAETRSGIAVKSDLKIHIGDDVSLKAYGLKTNLNGLLSVRQEKGNLGLYGEVNLKNGRYASFGQDLIIRKGLISFVGQPSQPFLNIEAIRNPEAMEDNSVTAGVKVTGLAGSPSITVFSEPGMPQDQALAYILTGRSLENSGDASSSGSVGAALLGMGLAKTGNVVGGIGKAFGIKDLNLGTQGVGDSSKVVVSGNITPRLQVKYGVGLFDGLAEVTLRYRLLPQLYVQSVSGVNQAFDLLYQFEF